MNLTPTRVAPPTRVKETDTRVGRNVNNKSRAETTRAATATNNLAQSSPFSFRRLSAMSRQTSAVTASTTTSTRGAESAHSPRDAKTPAAVAMTQGAARARKGSTSSLIVAPLGSSRSGALDADDLRLVPVGLGPVQVCRRRPNRGRSCRPSPRRLRGSQMVRIGVGPGHFRRTTSPRPSLGWSSLTRWTLETRARRHRPANIARTPMGCQTRNHPIQCQQRQKCCGYESV
jgi:hypothetical protein